MNDPAGGVVRVIGAMGVGKIGADATALD